MKIGFALVAANPFFEKIISIQNNLAKKYLFRNLLGAEHNLPHTTLFQGSFADNIDYIKIADSTAEKFNEFIPDKKVWFNDVIYKAEGWYFYMMKKTAELQQIHDFVLDEIVSDLILDPNRMKRNIDTLSKDEIIGISQYGYRYSGNAFLPHITIGRTSRGPNMELLKELNNLLGPEVAIIERITVYKMGYDGTHADTLYEVRI